MVFQPAYTNGIDTTIEMSQDGLRSILNQIESELLDSEVYRRTMAGLQTMLGEATNTAQILVKAVGREAVRLTFQEFARQYKVVPVSAEKLNTIPKELTPQPEASLPQEEPTLSHNLVIEEDILEQEETFNTKLVDRLIGDTKPPKKRTKTELSAQKVLQQRDELLRQVGQELRRAREARSLSTEQLYRQTLVPLHHIEALEAGHVEQLPEDVYIRGFIRRLGQALGLNGIAIAASLPEADPVKSVVPSWYQPSTAATIGGFQLSSVHLYLGYTALIAGAVGGLSWMSTNKSTPGVTIKPEAGKSSQSISPKANLQQTTKPGVKSSTIGMKAGADIAPPEASPL
ncbi:MAG: helix-turn-helix transcriptional regulator [Coleofasciculaceae cyanobacterium]